MSTVGMMKERRCCFPSYKSRRGSYFLGLLLFVMFISLLVTLWNDNGVTLQKLEVGQKVEGGDIM